MNNPRKILPRILACLTDCGSSATVVEPLSRFRGREVRAGSILARNIGSRIVRMHPGAQFSYETFTAITARGRPIVGCIVRREN